MQLLCLEDPVLFRLSHATSVNNGELVVSQKGGYSGRGCTGKDICCAEMRVSFSTNHIFCTPFFLTPTV